MNMLFYIAACIAVISTLMVIIQLNPVHALLYLVVSLLSIALIFLLLGAHFAAALEVIIYAGAIMVLFVFVVMMLNLGPQSSGEERRWLPVHMWSGTFAALGGAACRTGLCPGRGRAAGGYAGGWARRGWIGAIRPLPAGGRAGFIASFERPDRGLSPGQAGPSRAGTRGGIDMTTPRAHVLILAAVLFRAGVGWRSRAPQYHLYASIH